MAQDDIILVTLIRPNKSQRFLTIRVQGDEHRAGVGYVFYYGLLLVGVLLFLGEAHGDDYFGYAARVGGHYFGDVA